MPLIVDGTEIGEERIREEMQYHPAPSPAAAREAAEMALLVRAVLLADARRRGIAADPPRANAHGMLVEAPEEAMIRSLVEREVADREPTEADCRAYHQANPGKFRSPDLLQAAHILFAARPDDKAAMAAAKEKAEAALARLEQKPELFGELARELSDCTSRQSGGDLGQVTRGSTVPEFETFLFALEPGQICPVPIRTRYGFHIARLDRRLDGRPLPFEAAHARISRYLRERYWQESVKAFIARLMATARVERTEADARQSAASTSCGSGCGCANTTELTL
jgi:peptidyl-prolyl cis-trans isomerase C